MPARLPLVSFSYLLYTLAELFLDRLSTSLTILPLFWSPFASFTAGFGRGPKRTSKSCDASASKENMLSTKTICLSSWSFRLQMLIRARARAELMFNGTEFSSTLHPT